MHISVENIKRSDLVSGERVQLKLKVRKAVKAYETVEESSLNRRYSLNKTQYAGGISLWAVFTCVTVCRKVQQPMADESLAGGKKTETRR